MAADVAPEKDSAGNELFGMRRFHRAMTRITPRNDTTLIRKAVLTPAIAITIPPRAGPTARARLNSIPFRASAGDRSSFDTNSGKIARHRSEEHTSELQ